MAREKRRGAPGGRNRHLTGRYSPIPARVLARLMKGLRIESRQGCWIPAGSLKEDGYKHCYWTDVMGFDRTLTAVHLIARLFHRGGRPLEDDEVPHHLCFNPSCINPEHVQVVTLQQHARIHGRYRRAA